MWLTFEFGQLCRILIGGFTYMPTFVTRICTAYQRCIQSVAASSVQQFTELLLIDDITMHFTTGIPNAQALANIYDQRILQMIRHAGLAVLLPQALIPPAGLDTYYEKTLAVRTRTRRTPICFSARFSAMWEEHMDALLFYTVVDDKQFMFALTSERTSKTELRIHEHDIPLVYVPKQGCTWSSLQRALINRFEDDSAFRAIAAGIMLSTNPTGRHSGAVEALIPERFRKLGSCLAYNTPVDVDMITVLADAGSAQGHLVFNCSAGYVARSTVNEIMGRLTRIERPSHIEEFVESGRMLMPFVFT